MRHRSSLSIAAVILLAACATDSTTPPGNSTFPLTASVSETGRCTASVMGRNYESNGKIRGDLPPRFTGTLSDRSYHGLGCIVDNPAGEGDLTIVFAGNRFGQPLAVGTYQVVTEILDGSPLLRATVAFRSSSIEAERLGTFDGGRGTVVVDSVANGGRRIRVDADVFFFARRVF